MPVMDRERLFVYGEPERCLERNGRDAVVGSGHLARGARSDWSWTMDTPQQTVVRYLNEARASEDALVRVLQSQIAVTPSGSYRSTLETHCEQTRQHSARVGERLQQLGEGSRSLRVVVGVWEDLLGQSLALSKTPFDLLRGASGAEKVLKNAKDACATEALEIATYTVIEQLAHRVGDDQTATLAASIREDEEQMLQRILRELPTLADAVADVELDGKQAPGAAGIPSR
jgi:ferritin-like metal-binding protein YciE